MSFRARSAREFSAYMRGYTCRGHNYPVWDVAANPHGQYFASAGADRLARIWTVERNQPVRILAGRASIQFRIAALRLIETII